MLLVSKAGFSTSAKPWAAPELRSLMRSCREGLSLHNSCHRSEHDQIRQECVHEGYAAASQSYLVGSAYLLGKVL